MKHIYRNTVKVSVILLRSTDAIEHEYSSDEWFCEEKAYLYIV